LRAEAQAGGRSRLRPAGSTSREDRLVSGGAGPVVRAGDRRALRDTLLLRARGIRGVVADEVSGYAGAGDDEQDENGEGRRPAAAASSSLGLGGCRGGRGHVSAVGHRLL